MNDEGQRRGIRRISLYNLARGMIGSAYSPYLSFIGASLGLPGYMLGPSLHRWDLLHERVPVPKLPD
ncbi:MAG: hypothetical protein JCHSAcid_04450, partial [uncultured Acidilobus sp. JCHS]